jgi:hypothetical protein
MIFLAVAVFAALAGFIITSLQGQLSPTPVSATLAPSTPVPSAIPPVTPSPAPVLTTVPVDGISSRVQAARLLDQIERQVEIVRGLSPRAEVPLNFLDEREMSALLQQLYADRIQKEPLQSYAALGLVPEASPSIEVRLAVSVYVPQEEQLYVAAGSSEVSADDQVLLWAHAYGHALQDQHFDLQAAEARARTTDARLAVTALVEGDGMLLAALYRYGDLMTTDWLHLEELILQAELPSYGEELDSSVTWTRLQRFPYREGRAFAATLFETGGWETVNRAYADLPRSTEQVLHPERYLAEEPDVPTEVFVPDLSGALGKGWTPGARDTLGEFVAGLYLEQALNERMAWQAVDGWDGDTFTTWEHAEGGDRVLVWRTIWDTAAEADEFERALVASVPQRYLPTRPLEPPRGLPGSWWETDVGVVCVYRVARYVTFVGGPDGDTLAKVVEALP